MSKVDCCSRSMF